MDALTAETRAQDHPFSNLAHRILVGEKRVVLKELAEDMGLSYVNLYARLRGRVPFSAEQAAILMEKVPDRRFVEFFLAGTPFVAGRRAVGDAGQGVEGFMDDALLSVESAVALLRALEAALRDTVLTPEDVEDIQGHIQDTEHSLATLRNRLERCVRLRVGPCGPSKQ